MKAYKDKYDVIVIGGALAGLGFCRSQLIADDIFVCPDGDGRRMMDKEWGYFHPCSSYPLSNTIIKIPIE